MNVYIGGPKTVIISDMQGPCPDGFHVPLKSEWTSIINAYTGLGLSGGDNFATYLKMPKAGSRPYYDVSPFAVGSEGFYWSSSNYNNNYNNAWALLVYSHNAYPKTYENEKGTGCSIRGLKNTPVTPTSSRTVLYQGTGSAGIYWNSIDGLISISADGTTWYTLMDKNLGATTVYNYGDTLTDANCGNVFQWGNNYAFPGTLSSASITTSGTQVNASTYGPGNYYSSNKFIIGNNDWDSSLSTNLRGGVSQGTSTKTEYQEVQNMYIGEYVPPYLCFTANTAGSTVQLTKYNSPTAVTLETSTDGNNWTTYTIGNTITLSNIGDKVYWRNTSTTDTGFSTDFSIRYSFIMTGSISGSGDVNYLLNKNSTTSVSSFCFARLFDGCTALTTPPKLPATTLAQYCYRNMFFGCTSLETLPSLPATTLADYCYQYMFYGCSKIKLSTTQTGEYQTPYRIPTTGTGTTGTQSLVGMFDDTGGTFTSNPSINTTYYTSNTVE